MKPFDEEQQEFLNGSIKVHYWGKKKWNDKKSMNDHDQELINDAIEGTCPMCGGDVALGHCMDCGEPVDAVEEDE
jgi:hypothetical protein